MTSDGLPNQSRHSAKADDNVYFLQKISVRFSLASARFVTRIGRFWCKPNGQIDAPGVPGNCKTGLLALFGNSLCVHSSQPSPFWHFS